MGKVEQSRGELRLFAEKLALVLFVVLLWRIHEVVILIVIAAVLAAGIAPAVRRVRVHARHRFHKRIARGTAVLVVYLPLFAIVALVLVLGVPFLVEQSKSLMVELPNLLDKRVFTPLQKYVPVGDFRAVVQTLQKGQPVTAYVRGAATAMAATMATLVLVFYMLIDAERLKNLFLLAFPSEQRAAKNVLVARVGRRMSAWLGAQLILATTIGVVTLVVLLALRIPYALPLALLAAVGELIPIVGPIIGAIPALVVALFQSPWQFWAMLVAAILIQQIENLVLVPRLMGDKLHVSPLAIFIAFMIGASLLGIIGAVLAAPLAAVAQLVFEEVYVARRERRQDGARSGAIVTSEAEEEEERQRQK